MTRALSLLALLVLAAGCDSSSSEPFDIAPLLGTYTGTRTVSNGRTTTVEDVTATFEANPDLGSFLLTVQTPDGPPERTGGTYDEDGLRVDLVQGSASIQFRVGSDGRLRGDFDLFGVDGDISGTLTPSRFDLVFSSDENDDRSEIRTTR